MKEKWTCPNLDVQVFAPQEYCDTCWIATVECIGESHSQGHNIRYISFPPNTKEYDMHWNGHTNHDVTYHLRVPDGHTPTIADINYVIEVETEGQEVSKIDLAHGRSSSSHEGFDGWGWLKDGNVHFTYNPNFEFYTPRPNHS